MIPVVGNLFKYRSRSRAKTNLMVFLRPTVIRTNEQSVNVAGNRYDLVVAGMIIIGIIGLMLDGLMRLLEQLKSVRWRYVR